MPVRQPVLERERKGERKRERERENNINKSLGCVDDTFAMVSLRKKIIANFALSGFNLE